MAAETDEELQQFLTDFFEKIQRSSQAGESSKSIDITPVKQLIERHDFWNLLHLYSIIAGNRQRELTAVDRHASNLANEVSHTLRCKNKSGTNKECKELLRLINLTNIQALLVAHDQIANRDFEPHLPDIPYEVDEDEGFAVKIVKLVKNEEPLGATIKVEEGTGAVLIARLIHGGVADRSGCISVGDRLLEVNDVPVTGKSPADVVKILASSSGTVTFKLIPSSEPTNVPSEQQPPKDLKLRLRALFDYNPKEDPYIPCPDAGLEFKRRDVVHIVSTEDPHWWQARLETNAALTTMEKAQKFERTGLIPSKLLKEKIQATQLRSQTTPRSSGDESSPGSRKSFCYNNVSHSKRVKKVMYETGGGGVGGGSSFDLGGSVGGEQFYEEVTRLFSKADLNRPLVLIGPPGVGRNEMKRRLMLLNPTRYGTTVPHTSRPRRPGELEGVEYHFESREQMEQWIQQGAFIEYGEYKGNLYGTLLDSVKTVMKQGRICIINPHPQALARLRIPEIKPYILFVKPPPFPVLRETRTSSRAGGAASLAPFSNRPFSDDELATMIQSGQKLLDKYGHLFDYVLVNGNIEVTFRELCDVLLKVETETQWVPSAWI